MDIEEKSAIQINKVFLMESNFRRTDEKLRGTLKNSLDIDIEIEHGEPLFFVSLIVNYVGSVDKNEQLKSNIIMKAEFEIIGEKPDFYDEFCKVNAPAIIYPYLREHLASLTTKADITTINLPPFNFVAFGKLYFKQLKKQKQLVEEQKKSK